MVDRDRQRQPPLQLVALHFTPITPLLIRGLYLSKQVLNASEGMANGKGFNLKLSMPGLDELGSDVLPPGFQLVASVRLGERDERRDGGVDVVAEIQIFKPWFDQVDIGEVRELEDRRLPSRGSVPAPAERAELAPSDPWGVWLGVLRNKLIRDLARTLSEAPSGGMAYAMEIRSTELQAGAGFWARWDWTRQERVFELSGLQASGPVHLGFLEARRMDKVVSVDELAVHARFELRSTY